MEFAVIWALVKKFWWVGAIALVLVAIGAYGHHERNIGFHQRDGEVQKLNDHITAQDKTLELERKAHEEALAELKAGQAQALTLINQRLREAQANAGKTKVITNTLVETIHEVDSRYPLPNAFVRLHDAALGEEGAAQGVSISGSRSADDGAPSPVAASVAASTIASNYGECTARGVALKAWQDWYTTNKDLWDKAVKKAASSPVVQP
jgi:hypothetical protein